MRFGCLIWVRYHDHRLGRRWRRLRVAGGEIRMEAHMLLERRQHVGNVALRPAQRVHGRAQHVDTCSVHTNERYYNRHVHTAI